MIIDIRELASKGNTIRFDAQIDMAQLIKGNKEITASSPLHVDLAAKYATGVVEVEGRLTAEIELVCSRCLSQVKENVNVAFHEAFAFKKDHNEAEEEENEINFVPVEKFDLTPYVEENVLLELPYIPLCDEACKGLCPICGTNRNETACGCREEKVDPRLAGLKDFFNK